ncbi:hypothetical protein [Changchengzhania lutea]|nr:hypothetical protein [Changchengzhania lutea]
MIAVIAVHDKNVAAIDILDIGNLMEIKIIDDYYPGADKTNNILKI